MVLAASNWCRVCLHFLFLALLMFMLFLGAYLPVSKLHLDDVQPSTYRQDYDYKE